METDAIEQAINEELEKLSLNQSDLDSDDDTENAEDFTTSDEKLESDFPESVFTYFEASQNRVNTLEQQILEDLEENDTTCAELTHKNNLDSLLNEFSCYPEEDHLKLKERIVSEIEENIAYSSEVDGESFENNVPTSQMDDEFECDVYKELDRQLIFEWRELEEKQKRENEQRLAEEEAEKKHNLNSIRKEEEKRRDRFQEFEEELKNIEKIGLCEHLEDMGEDDLQLELAKQQEVIKRLEEQMEEEKRAHEETQQEERRITQERCYRAAIKLQAAFRGTLARRWSKNKLIKKKEEEKRRQEECKERERRREMEERMKMELEEERRKAVEEEHRQKQELERRRAEYESAKERERHRLERECKLEEQKRKEEETKKMKEARERKEGEESRKIMEERMAEKRWSNEEREKEEKKRKYLKSQLKQKEEIKRLEEKESDGENGKVPKRNEERNEQKIEKRAMREEERRKSMKEQRIEDEKKSKEGEQEKRWLKEEERESEGQNGKVPKRNEEKNEQKIEQKTMREEERSMKEQRMEDRNKSKEGEQNKEKWWLKEEEREKGKEKRHEQEEKKKTDLKSELKQEEEIKRLEEKESREENGKVPKRNEERNEQKIKQREIREEERRKSMKEQRMEDEQKSKEGENNREELESEIILKEERNKIESNESKGNEGIVIKKNEEKVGNEDIKELEYSVKTEYEDILKHSGKSDKEQIDGELFSEPCLLQSHKSLTSILASPQSSSNGHHHMSSAVPTDNSSVTAAPRLNSAQPEIEIQGEKYEMDTRGQQSDTANSTENCAQDRVSTCLPDSTEQKRLSWMMSCTPWSKLSMQNKRKGLSASSKKRRFRRASVATLPPLPVDVILKSGPWSALRKVTTVTLEDLPGCSLSTLSECSSLQSLTLRRCGLQALEGLNQCSQLRHIDVQENSITYVDLGSLDRLEVLQLGRNRLTSIHGLDSVVNLTVLQLSHNIISCISGLGSLKRLQRLSVDHNQLISTRGLSDSFTLLYLDCSFNHLSHVEGLEHCALLNTLDLRGNSLTELPALKNHVLLRELYLDDNSISSLDYLESCWLPLLCCLSVAQNNITQLPVLIDLLSLRTLDISHNCLSELKNICLSLQGCICLQELNLNDNPVQKENNWRSSVFAARPGLLKLNGEKTGVSVEPPVGSTQLWSFQTLCQAHQHQLNSMLQRHSMEISLTHSVLDAQLLSSKHSAELFLLAEEQRYAHEYGDSTVSEEATHEPAVSSCLLDVSDGDVAKDVIVEAQHQHPAEKETQSLLAQHIPENGHRSRFKHLDVDLPNGLEGGCTSTVQKLSKEQPSIRCTVQAPRIDLKSMAATVIQRFWRKHRQSRRTGPSKTPEKTLGNQMRGGSSDKKSGPLNKDCAATVIQATWRGYMLRRRLGCALALAQISEGDEAFEEVDMDEFIFDEEAMESDWITPHSNALSSRLPPYSEQLLLPKPELPLPELLHNTPVLPLKPKHAWISSEVSIASEHQSLSSDHNARTQPSPATLGLGALSGRPEKILEEWGITNGSTALLMLKRAQKMKNMKKNNQQRKFQDPSVRLALFRNHSEQPITMEACKRSRPERREHIKAGRAEVSVEDALRRDPGQTQQNRIYQWLHTQAVQTQRNFSVTSTSDHFLPEIDPDIINGGRVQLVAGTRYRESPDSAARWSDATGFSPTQNQQNHVRRHSFGHTKKDVPSPKRVTSAPSRKERISFRDNPVQMSGGWGGGKKRAK